MTTFDKILKETMQAVEKLGQQASEDFSSDRPASEQAASVNDMIRELQDLKIALDAAARAEEEQSK